MSNSSSASSSVTPGPEAALISSTSQPIPSPTIIPQSHTSFLTASTVSIVLSLFGLVALGAFGSIHPSERIGLVPTLDDVEALAICWTRRWRTNASYERPVEKAAIHDVEALIATRPVTPQLNVRWTPQIRSISGPASDKLSSLPPRRVRSSPSNFMKPRNMFPDPHTNSAPPYTLSFPHPEPPAKSSRGSLTPPVTPRALAVSGMQTRSLGRLGVGSELVV